MYFPPSQQLITRPFLCTTSTVPRLLISSSSLPRLSFLSQIFLLVPQVRSLAVTIRHNTALMRTVRGKLDPVIKEIISRCEGRRRTYQSPVRDTIVLIPDLPLFFLLPPLLLPPPSPAGFSISLRSSAYISSSMPHNLTH